MNDVRCENCNSKSVCKYLAKVEELFESEEFYGMFEYLENNNLFGDFKLSKKECKHHQDNFDI